MEEFANQCKNGDFSNLKDIYEKLKKTNFSFISECFNNVNREMLKQNQFDYDLNGTTCTLVFQFMKYLVCANFGDSRGIIIFDDGTKANQSIFPLTHFHKPNLPQESDRILFHGGRIDKLVDQYGNKIGPDHIFKGNLTYPGLTITRSLGDFQAKDCGVISEPEINEYSINSNSKYMVICSKGVWEWLSNEDVRDHGNYFLQNEGIAPFCYSLVKKVIQTCEERHGMRDDITVVCVNFD